MGRILRTRCARAILFQTKLSILASGTIGASPRPVGARVVRPVHGPNPPDSLRSRKSAPGRFVDSRLRHHRGLTASSERASCSARPWAESFGLAALALFCSRQNCRFSPPAPSGSPRTLSRTTWRPSWPPSPHCYPARHPWRAFAAQASNARLHISAAHAPVIESSPQSCARLWTRLPNCDNVPALEIRPLLRQSGQIA